MANNITFDANRYDGDWTRSARAAFKKHFAKLNQSGKFKIVVQQTDAKFTPTRYKYYFDYIMFSILVNCKDHLQIIDMHGELKPIQNVGEVHAIMKALFNPVTFMDMTSGLTGTIGKSTTGLNDRDFIGNFMPQVIAKFSSEPYYVDLTIDYQDWKYHHEQKNWYRIKELITQGIEVTENNINNNKNLK